MKKVDKEHLIVLDKMKMVVPESESENSETSDSCNENNENKKFDKKLK